MLELIKLDSMEKEIEAYRQDVERVLEYTQNLQVKTKEDAKQALDYIAKSMDLKDLIEQKKEELTKDAKAYVNRIDSLANQFLQPLKLVKSQIYEKIEMFKFSYREEEEERKELAQDLGITNLVDIVPIEKIASENTETYESPRYLIEVLDIKEVPSEFLLVNESNIKLAIKMGRTEFPGLKITKTMKTIVKRKK